MRHTQDIWVTPLSDELYVNAQAKKDTLALRLHMTRHILEKLARHERQGVNIAAHDSLRAAIRATRIALIFLEENMTAQGIMPYR